MQHVVIVGTNLVLKHVWAYLLVDQNEIGKHVTYIQPNIGEMESHKNGETVTLKRGLVF
jgi:hypothetical protein